MSLARRRKPYAIILEDGNYSASDDDDVANDENVSGADINAQAHAEANVDSNVDSGADDDAESAHAEKEAEKEEEEDEDDVHEALKHGGNSSATTTTATAAAAAASATTSALGDAVHALEHKIEQSLLALWDELPAWQQDNHYIRSGYRRASHSFRASLASLTYVHNETVNIYTHLLGAVAAVLAATTLGVHFYSATSSSSPSSSFLPSPSYAATSKFFAPLLSHFFSFLLPPSWFSGQASGQHASLLYDGGERSYDAVARNGWPYHGAGVDDSGAGGGGSSTSGGDVGSTATAPMAAAPRYATASRADVAAFACFFAGAAGCLGMSAAYHAVSNHSPRVASLGNKLDYLGIVALIWGSFVASIYYGFYCHARLQLVYWSMISVLAVAVAIACTMPRFRTPRWRPYRAALFVAMALSAVLPLLHGWWLYAHEEGGDRDYIYYHHHYSSSTSSSNSSSNSNTSGGSSGKNIIGGFEGKRRDGGWGGSGLAQLQRRIGLPWLLLQGALYILGAVIYAARVPERFRPGAFDLWGSSHQIFHVLVVAAAAAHLRGLLAAFDYNHAHVSAACRAAAHSAHPAAAASPPW